MRIRTFAGGGFAENTYLVICGQEGLAVAVDPGAGADELAAELSRQGGELGAILLTHAHLDHVEGVARLKRDTGAPIYLHPADRPLYDAGPRQAEAFGVAIDAPPPPDSPLTHGQELRFGGRRFEVRHAPGHSPGHVILYDPEHAVAFVGDVIFRGSIGRTDLPGGDYRQLMASIREQVLTLPDETRLLTGHGPETTVEWERRTNPFLVPQYGGELA